MDGPLQATFSLQLKNLCRNSCLTLRSSGRQQNPWLRHFHGFCWYPPLAALLPAPLTFGVRPPTEAMPVTMKNDLPLRFKYKFTASSAILMVLAAFAVTASIFYIAYANPDSRLTRLLSVFFSSEALPKFYWGLAALSFVASLYVLRFAFSVSNAINHVELGPNGAIVPSASISMSPISIPYSAIRKIQVVNVQNHQLAVISSSIGEARLISKFFATPSDFTAFLLALEQRRHAQLDTSSATYKK
jgi:hypothetical protein